MFRLVFKLSYYSCFLFKIISTLIFLMIDMLISFRVQYRCFDRIRSKEYNHWCNCRIRRSNYRSHHTWVFVQTTLEKEVRQVPWTQRKLCGKKKWKQSFSTFFIKVCQNATRLLRQLKNNNISLGILQYSILRILILRLSTYWKHCSNLH